jgi:prepilin-type N-terminal cleavage/methylation domain-containing protein/prepilin-type processing-associated H-X9-DG protein
MYRRKTTGFTLIELLVVIAIISILAGMIFPVFGTAREKARSISCLSNMKQIGYALNAYLQDWDETFPMNRFPDNNHPLGSNLEGSSYNWKRAVYLYLSTPLIFQCPSNEAAWAPISGSDVLGDESNPYYPKEKWLPNSYAYNGGFFHEWSALESEQRPRELGEIKDPAQLILILESRYSTPDLGPWMLTAGEYAPGKGWFNTHNRGCNWVFADTHAKWMKIQLTMVPKEMWGDARPEYGQSFFDAAVKNLPREYR